MKDLRNEYGKHKLDEQQLPADPFELFGAWFKEALESEVREPNAMNLATANKSGKLSARTVLLKGFDENGLLFFTNYHSRKAKDLEENPFAALTFFWDALERQVRIEGTAEKTSREESVAYFHSRPRGSQLAAAISPQSEVVESREALMREYRALEAKIGDGEVPCPEHWGGFCVKPEIFEFWQGRPSRLHDRVQYKLVDGEWKLMRLAP